jgi:hypothetical protein
MRKAQGFHPSDERRLPHSTTYASPNLGGARSVVDECNFRPNNFDKLVEQPGHSHAVNQLELHPFFNCGDAQGSHQSDIDLFGRCPEQ